MHWRQRQGDFCVGQPGLQSEFHDSQDYAQKTCLKRQNKTKRPLILYNSAHVHRHTVIWKAEHRHSMSLNGKRMYFL